MNRSHNFRISAQAIILSLTLVMATLGVQATVGDYYAGDITVINAMRTANRLYWPATAGKEFDRWMTTEGVAFVDATVAATMFTMFTMFTMLAKAVDVAATYMDAVGNESLTIDEDN